MPISYLCGMIDYLIVGLGLAGISFCEQLEGNSKTYRVIADKSQTSSVVAGGLYNPVILKRFTLAWNAKEQLEQALPFYEKLSKNYRMHFIHSFISFQFISLDALGGAART